MRSQAGLSHKGLKQVRWLKGISSPGKKFLRENHSGNRKKMKVTLNETEKKWAPWNEQVKGKKQVNE